MMDGTSRAEVQMADVLMTLVIIVFMVVTAPIWWRFTGMVTAEADPLTSLLLELLIPLILVAVMASVAVSARRTVR